MTNHGPEMNMRYKFHTLFLMLAALALSACPVSLNPHFRAETAKRIASPAWMLERQVKAGIFTLTIYERIHNKGGPAHIYIEGDGLSAIEEGHFRFEPDQTVPAWISDPALAQNPTPRNPVALRLAAFDDAENVVYIARPCQYNNAVQRDEYCESAYWSHRRFAPVVVDAYQKALDDLRNRYGLGPFHVVGYGGGGAIAAILAAERNDVLSLRTVAGNLDHYAWTSFHNAQPLSGSLNAIDYVEKLSDMPQYHFAGGQDEIMPPAVLHSYLQAIGSSPCVKYEFLQEPGHENSWADKWPDLLDRPVSCYASDR